MDILNIVFGIATLVGLVFGIWQWRKTKRSENLLRTDTTLLHNKIAEVLGASQEIKKMEKKLMN